MERGTPMSNSEARKARQSAEKDAWLADVRRQAEYEIERFPNDDWPPIVLALLTILDERTSVTPTGAQS